MTITSHHNEKLKEIRKLRQRRRWRERSRRFVAEGEDLLAVADACGWEAVSRFCVLGSGLPGVEVEADALASVSGLASGTRALAVYEERWAHTPLEPLCVYLHGVQDPGNVGAVLRSAWAFGASCVAFGPGSADPFGPKAVRASMGAVFAVPVARAGDLDALPGSKIALVPGGGRALREVMRLVATSRQQNVTLLVGAEREGLPNDVIAQADVVAHIPTAQADVLAHIPTAQADVVAHIPTAIESLNAAMAATIALYEASRMAAR